MQGKFVSESALDNQRQAVRPEHLNDHGTVFGGHVMSLVDVTAAMAARRHAGRPCVTASIDSLHFISPIYLKEDIVLYAAVNRAWKTSLEVGVKIFAENPYNGERRHVASAYLTFVALDENNHPTAVPPLTPNTPVEHHRYEEADRRRAVRLELRKRKQ